MGNERDDKAEKYSKNHRHLNTRQHFIDGWNAALESGAVKKLVEELEYIEKNCELIGYELIGGDGAASGYLPFPQEMGFIKEALEQFNKAKSQGDGK